MRKDRLEELQKALGEKAAAVGRLLNTPDGKVLVDALKKAFKEDPVARPFSRDGAVVYPVDVNETLINVGSARVVTYILQLQAFNTRGEANANPVNVSSP